MAASHHSICSALTANVLIAFIKFIARSPQEVWLMIVAFKTNLDASKINKAVVRIRDEIKKAFLLVRYIIQPDVYKIKKAKACLDKPYLMF